MKRLSIFILILACVLGITGCSKESNADNVDAVFQATILEMEDDGYLVKPSEGDGEQVDLMPMVMIDGVLYFDTGHESTVEGRCGVLDGEITSEVAGNERPTENDQSNFGTGYGYQYGSQKGTIDICIDGKWWVYAVEEVK